ncbi:hypothetical protein [Pseudonocardia acaciae]|uniref:hypothetical protein n=1 Tax=Pseudonocardia acaciae TaxID=551276 RepID=UPI00048D4B72|nr:hypothetical protein [Pseudonocardia acaciae]
MTTPHDEPEPDHDPVPRSEDSAPEQRVDGEPGEKGTSAEKPDHDPASAPPTEIGADEVRSAQNTYFSYHFHSDVNNNGPTAFGQSAGDGARSRRSTGRIPDYLVDLALRWFVRPGNLDDGARTLRAENLLIITGYEGAGKKAAGLALLREVGLRADGTYPELVGLSPASSLATLAENTFREDRGYLIQDFIGDTADAAVQFYDVERLAECLQKSGAYLVITTQGSRLRGRDLTRFTLPLRPPTPSAILDHRLEGMDIDTETRQRARAYVQGMNRPREILAVAERIRAGGQLGDALECAETVGRTSVHEWFDGGPGKREILYVAALAFQGVQPEPLLELRLENLYRLAIPEDDATWAERREGTGGFEQRKREHPLVTFCRPGDRVDVETPDSDRDHDDSFGWPSGKTVRFRSPRYADYVVEELHERYGAQLWEPLRQWIVDIPSSDPTPHAQLQLSRSLAGLARLDFAEVYASFLNRWAAGTAHERATAALVLWFITDQDEGEMTAVALQTAMRWGNAAGLSRAVTSAAALGGPLGLKFRPEAMRRLCFLALRAQRIGVVARLSVQFLFAAAVQDGPENAADILLTVRGHLDRATAKGRRASDGRSDRDLYGTDDLYRLQERRGRNVGTAAQPASPPIAGDTEEETFEVGWNIRVARAARSLVVSLLTARGADNMPLTATILVEQTDNVPILGELWADVLCSAPHRTDAIDALTETLRAVEREPGARASVTRLGAAIHANMPTDHRSLRTNDLLHALSDERRGTRPAQVLVTTLLSAVRGS